MGRLMWHCVPADVMGFWQSKMRYRSSDELVMTCNVGRIFIIADLQFARHELVMSCNVIRLRIIETQADIAVQFATRKIPLDVLVIGENQLHRLDQWHLYACHIGRFM